MHGLPTNCTSGNGVGTATGDGAGLATGVGAGGVGNTPIWSRGRGYNNSVMKKQQEYHKEIYQKKAFHHVIF